MHLVQRGELVGKELDTLLHKMASNDASGRS
jgi:hypothetical protein